MMRAKILLGGVAISLGLILSGCATFMGPSQETKRMEEEIQLLHKSVKKLSQQNIQLQRERDQLYKELRSISQMFQQALQEEKKERERLRKQIQQLSKTIQERKKREITPKVVSKPTPKPTKTGREEVKKIQKALKRAGYDPGPIDGKIGPLTRNALQEFQKENGLPVTGKADASTMKLLQEYMEELLK